MQGSPTVADDALPQAGTAPRRRGHRGRVLRVVGVLFLLAALSIGGYLGWLLWGTGLTTSRAQSDLREGFEGSVATLDPSAGPSADEVVKVPGRAVAILVIPRMDLDMVVVEGTGTEALKKGPGHYTQTAYPWEDRGRVGIAGHRTTYGAPFWDLDRVREGDRITLETEYGVFEYRVTRRQIILPSEGWVLDQTKEPTLVLTTCNPRFSAAQRLVVFAERVSA